MRFFVYAERKVIFLQRLTFDRYTGMISMHLLGKTTKQVLECFLQHLSPEKLVTTLRERINRKLKELAESSPEVGNALYRALNTLLEGKELKSCWELDDEGNPSLTETGARQLLEASGHIKTG